MTSLGFENYAEALKIYLSKYREVRLVQHFPVQPLSFPFACGPFRANGISRPSPLGANIKTGQLAVGMLLEVLPRAHIRAPLVPRGDFPALIMPTVS